MKVFCPSKDRAQQLDLLICSMEMNLPNIEFDITVLYKYTNKLFKSGYDKLKEKQFKSKVKYLEEVDFENDFWCYLKENADNFVMLLTDDCVFYRKYDEMEKDIIYNMDESNWCWSPRLGLNTTTQYYLTGQEQDHLEKLGYAYYGRDYGENAITIQWNWKIRRPFENYGYMISWDGNIMRGMDLLDLAKKITFYNPRTFEDKLTKDLSIRNGIERKYMISPEESILFVNTINSVQEEGPPSGTKHNYSVEELNNRYLAGEIIDMKSFDGLSLTGSHDEVPLLFKKED